MSNQQSDNSLQNFLIGVIVGLLTGGILSLMYSPNSGSENRRLTRKWAEDTGSNIKDKATHLKEEVENPYSKARQFIDEKRYNLEQQWNKFQARKEASKMSEAKEREAESWDTSEDDAAQSDVHPAITASTEAKASAAASDSDTHKNA